MKNLYLTNELRDALKNPMGKPLFGTEKEVDCKFKRFLTENKFKKIITVGDYCSSRLVSGVKIFDGRVERNKAMPVPKHDFTVFNPPAAIDKGVWRTMEKAIRGDKNVFVEGEEDLLVIPAVLFSKDGYLVVYGYPGQGVCLVPVTEEKKKEVKGLLMRFKSEKFEKIAVGGTFDRLHQGHKYFLAMAKYYAKKAIIGLSSDEFIKGKKEGWKKIQKFEERKANLEEFLREIKLKNKIFKLDDVYGPSVFDKNIEAILLTQETLENGVKINKERKMKGLKELNYVILPYLSDEKGGKISSRNLRKSEIKKENKRG